MSTGVQSGELHIDGYLAEPTPSRNKGILVLHPWWGLNEDVTEFCRRLADSGFIAFAPDMFEGQTATTIEEAEALTKAQRPRSADIQTQVVQSAKYLKDRTGQSVSVVGFSYGAYYALELSNEEPDLVSAAVIFYGTGHEEFGASKATYLCHFAEEDDFEPKEAVDSLAKLLEDAGRPATFHIYPGTGHWFFEADVIHAYNGAAAELAWERTLQFLEQD